MGFESSCETILKVVFFSFNNIIALDNGSLGIGKELYSIQIRESHMAKVKFLPPQQIIKQQLLSI